MEIVHAAADLKRGVDKVCLAIGVFDGVHLGHQQVIRQCVADAEQQEAAAVVVTFDCHPSSVVAPERTPLLIYTVPQKLRAFASMGVDYTLLIHFDRNFSQQSGQAFIRSLSSAVARLTSISVGSSFVFGHNRDGNVALLQELGEELRFAVRGLAAVALDGQTVSSTRIREAVAKGEFNHASQMLGREYALSGTIVRGDQLGKKMGFPTANLETAGLVLPPVGVYAAHAYVMAAKHRAVVNIGYRPTVAQHRCMPRVEAHLLDFDVDLYGHEIELTFVDRLRNEKKFGSVRLLRKQIAADIAQARKRFAG